MQSYLLYIGIFALIFLLYIKVTYKLSIDFKSLYRKGFKKIDNAFGVWCFCGKQGRGKTYSCVHDLIECKLKTNCIIITNVSSFKVFSDTIFIFDIQELIDYVISYCDSLPPGEYPNIVIFYDEIFTILEKQTKINKDILSFLSQLRKRHIMFFTTAQEWLEINITFRRYVRYQVDCNMISLPIFNTAFIINSVNDGEQLKWSEEDNDYIAPRIQTNLRKGNLSIAESYDTFETINTSSGSRRKDSVANGVQSFQDKKSLT